MSVLYGTPMPSQKFFSKKSIDPSRTFPYSTTQSEKGESYEVGSY